MAAGVSLARSLGATRWCGLGGNDSGSHLLLSSHACRKIAALTVLGYLPWLVFTVAYYGSPVPNTIVAKAAGYIYNTQYHFRYPTSLHLTVRELPDAYRHLLMRLSPYYVGHGLLPIAMLPFSVPINLLNYFLMMVGLVILGVRGKWGIVLYLCLYTVFFVDYRSPVVSVVPYSISSHHDFLCWPGHADDQNNVAEPKGTPIV